ncbi:MAG: hypothetical protein KBS55_00455 [Bacteroidales bacterium]|nr:hypothetical protein [Candidatus Cryptobacteroides aphodequi]
MRFVRNILAVLALTLSASFEADAQFYLSGNEPCGVRWAHVQSESFDVIYPEGLDSLGRAFALKLEQYKMPNSYTVGFYANQYYKRKPMPVVLHNSQSYANGMVVWTPHRMELYTNPEPYRPEATPWTDLLSVHEGRHATQMQYVNRGSFKVLTALTGEIGAAAMSALYCGPAFLEGDAVVAETALTASGRGRSADFLEYYKASFAQRDFRDYWRWRYGSARLYTPDYYRAGYVSQAGLRSVYADTMFVRNYYDRLKRHLGVAPLNWRGTMKKDIGETPRQTFFNTSWYLARAWDEYDRSRLPFTPSERISATPKFFEEYTGMVTDGKSLYAVRDGMAIGATELVRVPSAPSTGVRHDPKPERLARMGSYNSSLSYSPVTGDLYWAEVRVDRRWEMVSWSDIIAWNEKDGRRTLVKGGRLYSPAAHPCDSLISATEYLTDGTTAVAIFTTSGARFCSYPLPAGMQAVESAWTDDGTLWCSVITAEGFGIINVHTWKFILPARSAVKICGLRGLEGGFLNFESDLDGSNEMYRLDVADGSLIRLTNIRNGGTGFAFVRDSLYYSSIGREGRLVYGSSTDELDSEQADWNYHHKYPFAEDLSAQERILPEPTDSVKLSEPQPYKRLAHAFRVHSWLPVQVYYDEIDDISSAIMSLDGALGATAFFQNTLGTLSGYVTAGARSSGMSVTYRGLYPVLNASVTADYPPRLFIGEGDDVKGIPVIGRFRAYLPLNFSSGGWSRGVVPSASINTLGSYTLAVRAYTMLPTPEACVYPRLGVGAELAFQDGVFAAAAYGYLPGIAKNQSISWTGIMNFGQQAAQLSAEYAIPFGFVDWSALCPFFYVRNFEIYPHAQITGMYVGSSGWRMLYGHGLKFDVVLGNFLFIPYTTRLGLKYTRFNNNFTDPIDPEWELVFSIDL